MSAPEPHHPIDEQATATGADGDPAGPVADEEQRAGSDERRPAAGTSVEPATGTAHPTGAAMAAHNREVDPPA